MSGHGDWTPGSITLEVQSVRHVLLGSGNHKAVTERFLSEAKAGSPDWQGMRGSGQ